MEIQVPSASSLYTCTILPSTCTVRRHFLHTTLETGGLSALSHSETALWRVPQGHAHICTLRIKQPPGWQRCYLLPLKAQVESVLQVGNQRKTTIPRPMSPDKMRYTAMM